MATRTQKALLELAARLAQEAEMLQRMARNALEQAKQMGNGADRTNGAGTPAKRRRRTAA